MVEPAVQIEQSLAVEVPPDAVAVEVPRALYHANDPPPAW